MFNWGQNSPLSGGKDISEHTRDAEVTSYLGKISDRAGLGKDALSAEGEGEC